MYISKALRRISRNNTSGYRKIGNVVEFGTIANKSLVLGYPKNYPKIVSNLIFASISPPALLFLSKSMDTRLYHPGEEIIVFKRAQNLYCGSFQAGILKDTLLRI
jgi:hypothetical protein